MQDNLTVLTSKGPLLTKTWKADGSMESYGRAKHFSVGQFPVHDIHDLSSVLLDLQNDPHSCVIRGQFKGQDFRNTVRKLEQFDEVPRSWVCLDVDEYQLPEDMTLDNPAAACDYFVCNVLPSEFHHVTFHWQLSSSAGKGGDMRTLKAHLWFWLKDPRGQDELEAWGRSLAQEGGKPPVDVTVFRTVQVHYTAAPVIEDGVECPIAVRSGLFQGVLDDEVDLLIPEAAFSLNSKRPGRGELADPTQRRGIHGLFAQLYPPDRVIDEDLCEGTHEWQDDSDVRITWLGGGGSAGGVCITDDNQHFYCSQNSDPFEGRAVGSWDFVRQHRFGELDDSVDVGALEFIDRFAPLARPSEAAMRDWVRTLPDVAEVLGQQEAAAAAVEAEEQQALAEQVEAQVAVQASAVAAAILEVGQCPDATTLETVLASRLAGMDWTDGERVRLVAAIQGRFRELTATSLPVAQARAWMLPPATGGAGAANGPDWLEDWVWITRTNEFYQRSTGESMSTLSFDFVNSLHMPLSADNLHRETPSDFARKVWTMKEANDVIYAPGQPEEFAMGGVRYVNTYDPGSVPEAAPGDGLGVTMLQKHLARLFPDQRERELLISWMAWVVRNPGKKLTWAPYVFGPQGTGKSFLGQVMTWVMGKPQVGTVSSATVTSGFTSWVQGAALRILEEAHEGGKGWMLEEALKTPITEDSVLVHIKGRSPFDAPNFTNYLLLSNHNNALPITEGDRRYLMLKVALSVADAKALDKEGYFKTLWETCGTRAGELRHWLVNEVVMHEDFVARGRAPETKAKQMVIEEGKSDVNVFLSDLLEGKQGFCTDVVAAKLKAAGIDVPKSRAMGYESTRLGFEFWGPLKIGGKKRRVWVMSGSVFDHAQARLAANWGFGSEYDVPDEDDEQPEAD